MRVYIIDLAGWSLVGMAAGLGIYACYLFETRVVKDLTHSIIQYFS